MRRALFLPLLITALLAGLLAGCGGGHHVSAQVPCPQAANGHGHPGVCAPKTLGLTLPRSTSGPVYPDRSNNDPCYCGVSIRSAGQVGLIVKANQGVGFIDPTAVGMVLSARAAGLAVGMYDFDQDYSLAEARLFVSRLKAAGLEPNTPNTFPAYFDVEYGSFSYSGLIAQIRYVQSQGYRVGVYTGDWYWGPHAGCRWPGVTAWLSGYPNAIIPCGLPGSLYQVHQFTSTPVDLSVFLGSTSQFKDFVRATPSLPVCFSHRIPARSCTVARAKVASRLRAAASSERAFKARGCPVLAQRIYWFSSRLKSQPHTKIAHRKGALATSRRVYQRQSCGVFKQRADYFTAAAAFIREAN